MPPGSRIWSDIALARATDWPLSEIRALDELDRVALLSYMVGLAAGE